MTTDNAQTKLANCPFCGKEPKLFGGGVSQETPDIGCTKCSVWMSRSTHEEAIREWNYRTEQPINSGSSSIDLINALIRWAFRQTPERIEAIMKSTEQQGITAVKFCDEPMIRTNHFHNELFPLTSVLFALASQENNDGDEGKAMNAAAEEIIRLRSLNEAVPQWLDIESAPRDGQRVLLYSKFFQAPMIAFYQVFNNQECWEGENRHRKLEPTHWMPLPQPPKEKDMTQITLENIEKAREVLDMWINDKVNRHNQDRWLDLISNVDSVDDETDILKVLATYLGVKYKKTA